MTNDSGTTDEKVQTPMTSNGVLPFLQHIVTVYILSPLSLAGLIGNVINIIIFSRMNQRQTTNISLLAMAISDLTSLMGMLFNSVCFYPAVVHSKEIPFIPREIQYITGSLLFYVGCTNTSILTLLTCAERCLCIVMPFKVKTFITVGRIRVLIIGSLLWSISIPSISFYGYQFVWKFSEERNRTVLGVSLDESKADLMELFLSALNVGQYIVYVGVVILTIILVVKLRRQSKWRQISGQSVASTAFAKRDTQVAKTVLIISAIFILFYLPDSVIYTCTFIIPGFYIGGAHHELVMFAANLTALFMSINSSVNIIVYLKFNSEYRKKFKRLCGWCCKCKSDQ